MLRVALWDAVFLKRWDGLKRVPPKIDGNEWRGCWAFTVSVLHREGRFALAGLEAQPSKKKGPNQVGAFCKRVLTSCGGSP